MLAVIETHPVQYHAPVYRCLAGELNVPVTVLYGSDFSVAGYRDKEFNTSFAWDTDLLSGYDSVFLSRREEGGAASYENVRPGGLADALGKLAPGAVMALGYRHPFDRAAILTAFRNHRPLLFRGETTDHALARNPIKSLLRDTLLRAIYKRSAAFLYLGKRSRLHYERLGADPAKFYFSPYCVNAAAFQAGEEDREALRRATRAELGIADDRKVILYSGKLSHRKGVDLAIEAVRTLPKNLRDTTTFLLLGDGAGRESLENLARVEPCIDARFLGFQNQTRLSRIYHASDLLTLPSRSSETWGLVVNEGLLHGLPCVVSDGVGSHPDLIEAGVTGEVFPAGDTRAFSAALEKCLAYAPGRSLRSRCRDRVGGYSVRKAAEGIAAAYHDLPAR